MQIAFALFQLLLYQSKDGGGECGLCLLYRNLVL